MPREHRRRGAARARRRVKRRGAAGPDRHVVAPAALVLDLAVFEEERFDADEEPLGRIGNDLRRLDSLLSFLFSCSTCPSRKSSVVVHGPRSVARRDKRGLDFTYTLHMLLTGVTRRM